MKWVIALVSAVAAASALQSYSVRSHCAQPDAYGFLQAKSRVAELRENLPPDTIFGYLSDVPATEHTGGMARQALQYALAPVLVLEGDDPKAVSWVIGNFSRPEDFVQLGAARGLRLVRDFGNGIVLYQVERR